MREERDERARVRNVLVVDHSDLTHALVERVLNPKVYRTVHAHTSIEALDRLDGEAFDAVVVDIEMPRIDGIQLVQLLRARPGVDRSIPVIFYSAHVDKTSARRRIAEIQPATAVAKDGKINDLVEAVSNLISAHETVADSPEPAEIVLHVGKGLAAVRIERDGRTVHQLWRGSEVLLEAPTIEALTKSAAAAGFA